MHLAVSLWTNWGAWIPSSLCALYQQQSPISALSSFLSSADLSLWGQPALINALGASSQGFVIYLKHFSGSQKGQIKKEKSEILQYVLTPVLLQTVTEPGCVLRTLSVYVVSAQLPNFGGSRLPIYLRWLTCVVLVLHKCLGVIILVQLATFYFLRCCLLLFVSFWPCYLRKKKCFSLISKYYFKEKTTKPYSRISFSPWFFWDGFWNPNGFQKANALIWRKSTAHLLYSEGWCRQCSWADGSPNGRAPFLLLPVHIGTGKQSWKITHCLTEVSDPFAELK